MCVYFKGDGEIGGWGVESWGEMAQMGGMDGARVGMDGAGAMNGWGGKVTLFRGGIVSGFTWG